MCGIMGCISDRAAVSDQFFDQMRDTLAHRGPDGAGSWRSDDGKVALGHRRLAIIDLTPGGHQPMLRGPYAITFNGEIYNFKILRAELESLGHAFRSESDTEVLLAAYRQWGSDCVNHLSGMFAFAIYDSEARTLFAARDRAGEKPFFYHHDGKNFRFASELKALLHDPDAPRRIDPAALDEYLAYGYVSGPRCLLAGYAKLPAAHCLFFDARSGVARVERYWSPPLPVNGGLSDEEITARLGTLIEDSVSAQMVADVPIGVLLSGGLDSSLVAAAAARASGQPIRTFTIAFPGHADHDESAYARSVAQHIGSEHIELAAEPASIDLLPKLVAQFDEPIADSSMVPTFLVSRLIRDHCTVALGGDGGDELFGGYLHHPWLLRYERLRRLGLHRLGLEPLLSRALPFGVPGRSAVLGLASRFEPELALFRMLDPAARAQLTGKRAAPTAERERALVVAGRSDIPDRFLALEFQTYMCDDILTKVDRASMLASLEVRAPLLDRNIVDFAFAAIPGRLKVQGDDRKIILRRLAEQWLPPTFDAKRKQGFSIPIARWMDGPWAPLVDDLMHGGSPLFDAQATTKLLRRMRGNDRSANRIFQLAMLEAWRRHYNVTL